MRRISTTVVAAALLLGPLAAAQTADAATTSDDTVVYPQPPAPKVQLLDCEGTTGRMGCGPGWFWRDGWRGWGCYPC